MASAASKAIGYGASGAAIGTAIAPGIGTAIGAGLGALGGIFAGGDDEPKIGEADRDAFADQNAASNRAILESRIGGVQGQQANLANAAQINMTPQDQYRAQQSQLANSLMAQYTGQAPTTAEQVYGRNLDKALASNMAMAASARGGANPALLNKALLNANAQQQQGALADTAIAAQQERAGLANALAGITTGARGQDIGLAQTQAGLQQQVAIANAAAQNQQQMQANELVAKYTAMGLSIDQAQFMANQELVRMGKNLEAGNVAASNQAFGANLGAIGSLAASAATMGG